MWSCVKNKKKEELRQTEIKASLATGESPKNRRLYQTNCLNFTVHGVNKVQISK